MQDVEIESLLEEAGYRFGATTGRYAVVDAGEDEVDYPTEDVADQLGIPVEDLIRWEEGQVEMMESGDE